MASSNTSEGPPGAAIDGVRSTGWQWRPDSALEGITAVRVETLESPSFVSWYEIEIVG